MSLLWFLLIGLAAGWIGSLIVKGSGQGLWINLLVGVVGAYLGGYLLGQLKIFTGTGTIGTLITAVIGAVVLLLVVRLFQKKA